MRFRVFPMTLSSRLILFIYMEVEVARPCVDLGSGLGKLGRPWILRWKVSFSGSHTRSTSLISPGHLVVQRSGGSSRVGRKLGPYGILHGA